MFAGVLFAANPPGIRSAPRWLSRFVAILVLLAGLWNALWYGLQHLGEFWGQAALGSGILLIIAALFILAPDRLPALVIRLKALFLLALLGCGLLYAMTIARL
jgi:hypothetical protein